MALGRRAPGQVLSREWPLQDGEPGEGGRDSGGYQESQGLTGHPSPPPTPPSAPRATVPPPLSRSRAGQSPSPPSSQLVEKRLVALAVEDGVPTTPSHCAATLGSGPEGEARARPGVSREACPAESECQDLRRHSRAHAHPCRPRSFAASPGQQELPALRAGGLSSPPQGPGRTPPRPDPRDAPVFREAPPAREPGGPADGSSEDEEELPSLAFLLASRHSLLPWGLSQSPAPAPGLPSPGGRGPRGAPQAPAAQRIGRGPAAPPAAKSRKRALCAGLAAAGKTPLAGASLRGSVRALAVGLLGPSLPPKRRCGSFVPGRRKKQHCSP